MTNPDPAEQPALPDRHDRHDWYERSGVRSGPHRTVTGPLDPATRFFPPRLVPYWSHPLVGALPDRRRHELLARHLYHYLTFTAHFETRVVNRAAERIADGRTGLALPAAVRLDAYRIYCDEGYHALAGLDAVEQIAEATGIPPLPYAFDPFLRQLDGIGSELLAGEPVLAQLLQVVVAETLAPSALEEVPEDRAVLPLVRDVVRDHAQDEGHHHTYFSRFFERLWGDLPTPLRRRVARCLPGLIGAALSPDLRAVGAALTVAGLGPDSVRQVIAESYRTRRSEGDLRVTARRTVRLFRNTGVLEEPCAAEAFFAAGLLSEAPDPPPPPSARDGR
ncbi:diiron oxygenase [Streptomyces atriruber]|uniref:diiron oxygenase n=1 Tax=Streptomyces atriruber TaxID=545121 RepID=UPI0006E2F11B|nr:diiron oxygenase [Streptomyces atriruber]